MPRASIGVLLLCCLSALGYSQTQNINVFGGYSHLNANGVTGPNGGMNGLETSVEGKVLPFISMVGDFSWNYQGPPPMAEPLFVCVTLPGSRPGACLNTIPAGSVSEYTFLFGPRASFKIKDFTPFLHALFGGAHVNEGGMGTAGTSTTFAAAYGGGIDYRLTKQFSWRIQADAVQTRFFNATQTNTRISTGIVVRF